MGLSWEEELLLYPTSVDLSTWENKGVKLQGLGAHLPADRLLHTPFYGVAVEGSL